MTLQIGHPGKKRDNAETPLAARLFTAGAKSVTIWEETGESIARHIWYLFPLKLPTLAQIIKLSSPFWPRLI